jgi:plasmid maintenance system antidote protein VapI
MSRRRNKPGEVHISPKATEVGRLFGNLLRTYGYNVNMAAAILGVPPDSIRVYIRGAARITPAMLERIYDRLEAPKLKELEVEEAAREAAIDPEP